MGSGNLDPRAFSLERVAADTLPWDRSWGRSKIKGEQGDGGRGGRRFMNNVMNNGGGDMNVGALTEQDNDDGGKMMYVKSSSL